MYKTSYLSPLGKLFIYSNGDDITEISFKDRISKEKSDLKVFKEAIDWLQEYFKGNNPNISQLSLDLKGTPFQKEVWKILQTIPYGKTTAYGKIRDIIEEKFNKKMSAQAIGVAIGKNPILIVIPCHRVISKNKKLTGYSAGLENKIKLLELEGLKLNKDFIL